MVEQKEEVKDYPTHSYRMIGEGLEKVCQWSMADKGEFDKAKCPVNHRFEGPIN